MRKTEVHDAHNSQSLRIHVLCVAVIINANPAKNYCQNGHSTQYTCCWCFLLAVGILNLQRLMMFCYCTDLIFKNEMLLMMMRCYCPHRTPLVRLILIDLLTPTGLHTFTYTECQSTHTTYVCMVDTNTVHQMPKYS